MSEFYPFTLNQEAVDPITYEKFVIQRTINLHLVNTFMEFPYGCRFEAIFGPNNSNSNHEIQSDDLKRCIIDFVGQEPIVALMEYSYFYKIFIDFLSRK